MLSGTSRPALPVERHAELAARYRHHYFARALSIPLFAGVREMLTEMNAAGHVLGVATGKSRAGLDHALDQQDVRHFFAATRCADEGFAKPHPGHAAAPDGSGGRGPRRRR